MRSICCLLIGAATVVVCACSGGGSGDVTSSESQAIEPDPGPTKHCDPTQCQAEGGHCVSVVGGGEECDIPCVDLATGCTAVQDAGQLTITCESTGNGYYQVKFYTSEIDQQLDYFTYVSSDPTGNYPVYGYPFTLTIDEATTPCTDTGGADPGSGRSPCVQLDGTPAVPYIAQVYAVPGAGGLCVVDGWGNGAPIPVTTQK